MCILSVWVNISKWPEALYTTVFQRIKTNNNFSIPGFLRGEGGGGVLNEMAQCTMSKMRKGYRHLYHKCLCFEWMNETRFDGQSMFGATLW